MNFQKIKNITQKYLRKISKVDLLILFFLFSVLFVFFLFFYRSTDYIEIRVKVTDQDVLYATNVPRSWYAERFEVGDVELDMAGRKIAEVIGLEKFDVSSQYQVVYVDLLVRATYDTRTKMYSTRGKNLRFGTPLRFNLSKVTFDGLVTEFPGSNESRNIEIGTRTILAEGRGIEPFFIKPVAVGQEIKDSKGTVLLKIISISDAPAQRVTQNVYGDLLLKKDPAYRDVVFEVEVRTKKVNGVEYMFDDIPVKVGETVPLNLSGVSLFPQVTALK